MKILIVGNGGREHAIGYKIKQSLQNHTLYFAPGNAGTASLGTNIPLDGTQVEALRDFCLQEQMDFTIVGPESALALGIVDVFQEAGLQIFGPHQKAALLETSKSYAKKFMERYDIPTAQYHVYLDYSKALAGLNSFSLPLVVKADGLAAGKGVFICHTKKEAETILHELMETEILGSAGATIVLEEFLEGKEVSLLCFTDGKTIVPMESASDYKKAYDHDQGPNTGGMGCVSPSPYDDGVQGRDIVKKTFLGMKQEGILYKGIVYIGLMLTKEGAKVLEYNVRFGDPETEVLLLRLETDLVEICMAMMAERLEQQTMQWKQEAAICVVLAAEGYPQQAVVGKTITSIPANTTDFALFHGATKKQGVQMVSDGGRVFIGTACGKNMEAARARVYEKMPQIQLDGAFYRKDIGLISDSEWKGMHHGKNI